ncbi:MAG: hypothetical protein PHD04_00095 [Candidatus Pacebacteria bacterium]|nr:hypothetical protein [Candidatus Paceibacterota bacterium]
MEVTKNRFTPAWLLGTIHDPTFNLGPRTSPKEVKGPIGRPEQSGDTVVVLSVEKKLRAA